MTIRVINVDKTAETIKNHIKESDYTYSKIADLLGISVVAVSKWCHGKSIPKIDTMISLAGILGCKIDDFLVTDEMEV